MSKHRVVVSLADKRLTKFCRAGVCFTPTAKQLEVDDDTLAKLQAEPKLSVKLYPADKTPEAPEPPADEAPADEAPADEAPADEAPADEAPAKPARQTRAAK